MERATSPTRTALLVWGPQVDGRPEAHRPSGLTLIALERSPPSGREAWLQSTYEGSSPDQVRPPGSSSDLRGDEADHQGQRGARQRSRDNREPDGLRLPGCQAILHEILHRACPSTSEGPRE